MDLTLPELNHNCFSTLDHSSDNSGNSVSINHSFALIDCKNPQNEQLHGAISVRSWINSANNDYLEENLGDLRKCLMQKILEFNCHSTSHIPTPAITKLYESLICLYFKTPKLWSHPLRWIIEVLIHADSLYASTFNPSISDEEIQHCLTNSAFSKQIKGNILHLLSLISEEFTTAQLTHSVKCIIKEGIHSDEILVRNILKQFINDVNHEEIRSLAIHTSAIWMSNFVLNNCHSSSADSYLDIVHIIYNSMQYSEDLYLTGINALINIFESDGVGLNSDRDKGFLLDFHVSELTKFKCTLQHLVELHSVNLQNGVQWNECKGYEALNKTVLLLSILSEKQMDYLIHRLSNSCDNTNNQYIHELFGMFLLTFSLTGHYPYDEDISDVALQIWLNIYEASISTTAYTVSNVHDEDAIKRIHTEFLQRAFIKFHYPKDLNQYYTVWNQEDRDLWLKFRQELSNCFLSVFRYLNLHDWFLQATNQLQSTICNCTNEELLANWQESEALLFILSSISEHVIYKNESQIIPLLNFAYIISNIILNYIHKLEQYITYSMNYDVLIHCQKQSLPPPPPPPSQQQQHHHQQQQHPPPPQIFILCKTVLLCIENYYSIIVTMVTLSEINLIKFILNSLLLSTYITTNENYQNDLIELCHISLCVIQIILKSKLSSSNMLVDMVTNTLEYYLYHTKLIDQTSYNLISYCIGMLLYISEKQNKQITINSLQNILYSRLETFRLLCTTTNTQDLSDLPQNVISICSQFTCKQNEINKKSHFITILLGSVIQMFDGFISVEQPIDNGIIVNHHIITILSKLLCYLKQSLTEVAFSQLPEYFIQYHKLLQVGLPIFTCSLNNPMDDIMISMVIESIHCIFYTFHYILEKYNKLDETILKPIQYFIEWLFNDQSNMNEHSSFINLASSLLSNILDKINILLINQTIIVDDKLFGKYIGYTKEERINHPLSPILMSFIGQSITEEIEISSRFISQLINFKSQETKGNQQRKSIFNLLNDDAHMSLKLFLSLAFSGISVPEWSTVESCIQLACHLLTILTYENNIDPLMILDDKLLFEINICILLILTKGVPPPEKLLIKYAELYCCLANLFPCKQFIFLSFITGNIQSISQEYQLKLTQIPHSNILIELITDCLCYTSLTERAQFVIMVTRPSLSLNKVTRSISTFIRLLSLQRHGNC
uniref:Importin N-terminal domain-containing protein n=3 Tax=Schistosoma mansoni TaxID=6183 RepID=A0A3Q0KD71_SCHMA